jgi:hypothetical protein
MRNLQPSVVRAHQLRALYDQVEGLPGPVPHVPRQGFHWRVIAAASTVIFIDAPCSATGARGNQLSIDATAASSASSTST